MSPRTKAGAKKPGRKAGGAAPTQGELLEPPQPDMLA